MRKESFLMKLWNVLWPPAIGLIAQVIATILGMLVIGIVSALTTADKNGMLDSAEMAANLEKISYEYMLVFLIVASLIAIPCYIFMIRGDSRHDGEVKRNLPMTNKDVLLIAAASAALALAANNIISLTPLPYLFPGFEDVNETIYSGGLILQIIAAGILGPIEEELGMRGITYLRMKRYWGKKKAMIFSALVFGVYHLNVVQCVYAFILGLFFAWLYERYESLWAPMIAHMSANIFVLMLSSNSVINDMLSTLVGYCLATCISVMIFYYGWRYMKQTDPRVELEFVEKEPDTLEKLTEEYKEHNQE